MNREGGVPTVMVADDEPDLVRLYESWLAGTYEVRTAHSGAEACDALDVDVDVLLLDRRMPEHSGDAVLEHIYDRGLDLRVSMVTAVEPDFDIVDMGFDDYLVKPVEEAELRAHVDSLLTLDQYDAQLREYFALLSKRALLTREKSEAELAASEEFARLAERIETQRIAIDATVAEFDVTDFDAAFRNIPSSADAR